MGAHFDELAAVAELGFAVYLVYRFEAEDFCGQQQGLGCAVELELDYAVPCKIVEVMETRQRRQDLKIYFETSLDLFCTYVPSFAVGIAHRPYPGIPRLHRWLHLPEYRFQLFCI